MYKTKQFYEQNHFCKWLVASNEKITEYYRNEARFLSSHIRNSAILLDAGCGTGASLEPILEKVSMAYGVDFSRLMLKEARKSLALNPKVKLKYANIEKLPYKTGFFDYVICMSNTYGNLDNPCKCLDEMLRVIKSDGRVILSVYSPNALKTQLQSYKEIGLNVLKYDNEAVYTKEGLISRRFTKKRLEEIAGQHKAGIQVKELTKISYIVILTKTLDAKVNNLKIGGK